VLDRGRTLDDALAAAYAKYAKVSAEKFEARDRAFVRLLVTTVLRRHGELSAVLDSFLSRPLPKDSVPLSSILLAGAAQLLILETPPHAAISLSVELTRTSRRMARFDKLTNAVLRRVANEGPAILAKLDDETINVPRWLYVRWQNSYGHDVARSIARASLAEPPLDITVRENAVMWAKTLGGSVLPTGTVRLASAGRIEELPGYLEGTWWVQDAASALPARLLGNVKGLKVADLCAAPGGKTAQLAAAGAHVTAVDQSEARMQRLAENMRRLNLTIEPVVADIIDWKPDRTFDAVLLDAPCTATGTIRRHPDILHLKRADGIDTLVLIQERLLDAAARLVKPGGRLVYCTCSLEPEEGETQIARFLSRHPEFVRDPIAAHELGVEARSISHSGELRVLPFQMETQAVPAASGIDGFFASRLSRTA
jgi:16S rRNA (cytosine967-C5)-methyltransferase